MANARVAVALHVDKDGFARLDVTANEVEWSGMEWSGNEMG
jgi:hypothetical protein